LEVRVDESVGSEFGHRHGILSAIALLLLEGVYEQLISPDLGSVPVGAPLNGPMICCISTTVTSLQGSGGVGAACASADDEDRSSGEERQATKPFRERRLI
jgi:hypothetical protein